MRAQSTQRQSLHEAISVLPIPAYFLDESRRIQWLNEAGVALLGNRVGESFCRIVAPENRASAQTAFAHRMLRGPTRPHTLTLVDRDGLRTQASVVSAPLLEKGRSVGVFGVLIVSRSLPEPRRETVAGKDLTPRQLEILRLLAEGLDTVQIADRLGVVQHTVRNHMRGLFRGLGVRSRLHAVARGYQSGLLDVERIRSDDRDRPA